MGSPTSQHGRVDMHQIGEVADRVGLSHRTVRYYEEMGLITPEARSEGGFRLYTDENIERLLLIMQMKPLGFSVEEMREVLQARDVLAAPGSPQPDQAEAAQLLARFAEYAEERSTKLRKAVVEGEKLAERLSRESSS